MAWAPFVKLPHKLSSSPLFYSTSACIACCSQQRASSSALLSVTLQLLLSAEGGDAPAQAACRSLRHCLSALTLQPCEVLKSATFGVHLLQLINLGRHITLFSAGMTDNS